MNFEYLVLGNPSNQEVLDAGAVGWELILIKGTSFWFRRPTI